MTETILYDRLVADDELGPFFESADLELLRRTQTDFLCEAFDVPEADADAVVGAVAEYEADLLAEPDGSA